MQVTECDVLYRPDSAAVRFLPEGPCHLADDRISFVGIQHGAESRIGSINVLNLTDGACRTARLPGRPGFAFPTDREGLFVAGVERELGFFDMEGGHWRPFADGIDSSVDGTIINDGVVFDDNLIFGCKELTFSTPKAGLYLWRRSDQSLLRLRDDQICSNGKAVVRDADGGLTLFDIDSPTRLITRCSLDIAAGTVGPAETVVDLRSDEAVPDGMILTPDHRSLIVAFYDPGDAVDGVARQYSVATGEVEQEWRCPGSPRVTCPQLVRSGGRIRLVLTTAIEHMSAEQQARCAHAGCLFIGDTPFETIGDQPVFSAF